MRRWMLSVRPLVLLVVPVLLSGCASVLPPIVRIEGGPPTRAKNQEEKCGPLILSQSHDAVSVEIQVWTDQSSARSFFGSSVLAEDYLPVFLEIRNLRDNPVHVDPIGATLESGASSETPRVPFQVSSRLKKKILAGKRYESRSFDPDRGVVEAGGSAEYAAPLVFAELAWLVGGGVYVLCGNARSYVGMGGTKGAIVANCFPKSIAGGERLSSDDFYSPVLLAPSGRASGFLYFPLRASLNGLNVKVRTDDCTVRAFPFRLDSGPSQRP